MKLPLLGMLTCPMLVFVSVLSSTVFAFAEESPEFSDQQNEYFEKQVRPLLAKRCFSCHGSEAKRIEGGFLMNSRESLLKGGDTDAAIVPGKPEEGLLIDSINYGDIYQMPPKGKLPAEEIAVLTKWVEMGAPWPGDGNATVDPREKFDLDKRRRTHWAWQPIVDPQPPKVSQTDWPLDPLDNFILSGVENAGLKPNPPADPLALMRRLHFDITGLPPTIEEIEAFTTRVADLRRSANASNTESASKDLSSESSPLPQQAIEELVDRLLKSPRFGERWGRHWLDLVRYAESRGHEFDYNAPNPWEYRDYVIRALNADVPYDQFLKEHLAGDLLDNPRTHPTEKFNESVIATGFWHLGEWVHSPVHTRKDEADRQENMIDVFGKTFIGMTIACARCHDHKFDAISQADYYAMAGTLQSSAYRLARYDTLDHNRKIAAQLADLREDASRKLARQTADAQSPVLSRLPDYLLAARDVLTEPRVDTPTTPPVQRNPTPEPQVFADFESGTYEGWTITGDCFGEKPVKGTLPRQQPVSGFQGEFYINTYVGGDGTQGRAKSATFTINHRYITMLVGGGAHVGQTCMNLLVDGKVVRSITGKNNERLAPASWNVEELQGKQAQLEIVDAHTSGWGHINVDQIVFTNQAQGGRDERHDPVAALPLAQIKTVSQQRGLNAEVLAAWVRHLQLALKDSGDPLHLWAKLAHDKNAGEMKAFEAALQAETAVLKNRLNGKSPLIDAESVIVDYTTGEDQPWMQDGSAFGMGPQSVGDVTLDGNSAIGLSGVRTYGAGVRDGAFAGLKIAPGWQNDHGAIGGWMRAGQTLRTPTFTIEQGSVHYLVKGAGHALAVVDSHRLVQGPLHREVVTKWGKDSNDQPRWITHNLNRHVGHRIHVEFNPADDQPFEVLMVAQGPRPPKFDVASSDSLLISAWEDMPERSLQAVADGYQRVLTTVSRHLAAGTLAEADHPQSSAALADWMIQHDDLLVESNSDLAQQRNHTAAQFAAAEQELAKQIKKSARVAMAMWDGDNENELLLIRGNADTPGKPVARGLLVALTNGQRQSPEQGSGRLEIAHQLISADNPLTSRVMVNRIWHHLTGRGIVPSTDNFGVLGEAPTHPELLDHLATRFQREGWSIKRMIKEIVLSRTYQMSSRPNPAATEIDPANKLLHRMRVRRLEGEAIRDSILTISGRLDPRMYGPSVNVYLTSFMTGRGRPGQGPLDGAGRRSIYISVRRNFLSPMMLAFDMPQPFTAIGRRTVSNVPAQALILMNDPLVTQQAELWAKGLLAQADLSPRQRIDTMYRMAFARVPTEVEAADALAFLKEQGQIHGVPADQAETHPAPWTDLCHVMFNVKEFIFIK